MFSSGGGFTGVSSLESVTDMDQSDNKTYLRIASGLILGLLLPAVLLWALWSFSPDAGVTAAVVLVVVSEFLAAWVDSRIKTVTPKEEMIGKTGVVAYPFLRDHDDLYRGNVQIGNESWTALANETDCRRLTVGRKVRVTEIDGLVVHVMPLDQPKSGH